MSAITCPYKNCGYSFEASEDNLTFEKFGRSCKCPKCGGVIALTRNAHLKHGKVHMSKKERLRLRAESRKN